MLDVSFYKGKRVLITGHTGFKGAWMCKLLINAGAEVIGYAKIPPTEPSLYELCRLGSQMKSVVGDIRDLQHLQQVFEETRPEIVIHMAAQPIVRESYVNPVYTYDVNVMGTVNVLECVRKTDSVKSFINVTTDKVYLNKEWEWGYRENEELNGYDPYSNSKSCSELVTGSYKNSFFSDRHIAVSTMRAGNYHEKEYLVTVDKPIDQGFLRRMAAGVPILDTVTRPCFVEKTGKKSFRIILTQGLNRQIRRMCEYFGYHVLSLKRVRIMNLTLSGLGEGEYREITKQEWKELEQAIAASSSETVIESGGHHGQHLTANERADRKAGQSSKGVLSGRPGDHDQSGVRPPLRRTGGAGAGDRHRSRKQSHYKSGV